MTQQLNNAEGTGGAFFFLGRLKIWGIFFLPVFISGCAKVHLTSERLAPAGVLYSKTVVLSASTAPDGRRRMENAVREALFAYQEAPGRSVDVVEELPAPDELVKRLKSEGYDSLLIVSQQSVVQMGHRSKSDWRSALVPSTGPLHMSSIENPVEQRDKPVQLSAIEPRYETVGREYHKGGAWLVDLSTGEAVWAAQGTLDADAYARSASAARSASEGLVKKLAEDGFLTRLR